MIDAVVARKALQALGKKAQNTVASNELAGNARWAGKYSPEGLEIASMEAELDGSDRILAKSIIGSNMGLGGSLY